MYVLAIIAAAVALVEVIEQCPVEVIPVRVTLSDVPEPVVKDPTMDAQIPVRHTTPEELGHEMVRFAVKFPAEMFAR
jgi:hypothetical protein